VGIDPAIQASAGFADQACHAVIFGPLAARRVDLLAVQPLDKALSLVDEDELAALSFSVRHCFGLCV
jgi:hypothetical protein